MPPCRRRWTRWTRWMRRVRRTLSSRRGRGTRWILKSGWAPTLTPTPNTVRWPATERRLRPPQPRGRERRCQRRSQRRSQRRGRPQMLERSLRRPGAAAQAPPVRYTQFSINSPGTRSNSRRLLLTSESPRLRAWPAIIWLYGPIGVPARASSARMRPACVAAAASKGNTSRRAANPSMSRRLRSGEADFSAHRPVPAG
jgi:hypothetical protein